MIKKLFLITIIIFSVFVLSPSISHAANYGLSIYPPLLRIHIKPGKAISQVIKIDNLSSSEKILVASIIPFTQADNNGNPVLDPKATAPWLDYFSLANSKIKLDEPFSIPAGSSEQLVLSLSIPENSPLRDLYATLTVSTYDNSLGQAFQGTSIRATIGSNMLITVSSQAFSDTILKIENFFPLEGTYLKIGNLYFVDNITPLKFTATVINEGGFAAQTKGVFRVTTPKNKPVHLEGILPVNVIAKSTRRLVNIDGTDFELLPSLSNIGSHELTLEIKTDNSNTQSTINVFFFPLKLCLGLFLTLFIVKSISKFTEKATKKLTS